MSFVSHFFVAAGVEIQTLTDQANISTPVSLGTVFDLTLTGDHQLDNPTAADLVSGFVYIWIIRQDGSGGHTLTFDTLFNFFSLSSNPTLPTDPNVISMVTAVYDGVELLCVYTPGV